MSLVKSKQRIADHGEVFTPAWMVEAMLDLDKDETERIDARFLEPACGGTLQQCDAMPIFWGRIPISMQSTRQGRPKGRSFWNPTPKTASCHGLRTRHFEPHHPWYYKALQDSHAGAVVDCLPFIDFTLDAIANSPHKYIDVAAQPVADVSANVPVNERSDKILTLVRANPKVTAQKMAIALGVTDKTIKRHLKALREQGRIQRMGSDKAGPWAIIERPA